MLYFAENLDARGIQSHREQFNFATVGMEFRLIEVYIVSAFERVEGWEVMDSSRVLFWLQGGSRVMEREEPGCGKPEPGMTRLMTKRGSWCIAPSR
jgi:hypothetical protein